MVVAKAFISMDLSTSPTAASEIKRLHITPFNPALLSAIIPPSLKASAQNISFHTLQTFPEKSYGYVDLPAADAQRLRNKLNGTTLKGSKMQLTEAHPQKKMARDEAELDTESKPIEKQAKLDKKRKRAGEVMPGAELRERKVQRGWTDPAVPRRSEKKKDRKEGKKERIKSKFTTGPELLFKASLPANVAANLKSGDAKADKKEHRERKGKEKVLVHEFEKNSKHATFLRSATVQSKAKRAVEFVEGKGWVDEDGVVVEEVRIKAKRPVVQIATETPKKIEGPAEAEEEMIESDTSSEGEVDLDDEVEKSSKIDSLAGAATYSKVREDALEKADSAVEDADTTSEDEYSDDESIAAEVTPGPLPSQPAPSDPQHDSDTSSSGGSSKDESSEDEAVLKSPEVRHDSSSSESDPEFEKTNPSTPSTPSRPKSSVLPTALSITIPASSTPTIPVHPLEALYKRRQGAEATTETPPTSSFSFFGASTDDIEDDAGDKPPMTPFTQQDISYRNLRSAAPTPDTAHPSRFSSSYFPPTGHGDDEGMAEEEDDFDASTPSQQRFFAEERKDEDAADKDDEAKSDFTKWFYENRGDANRAWKKRRKVVSKDKRQTENRRRGEQRL